MTEKKRISGKWDGGMYGKIGTGWMGMEPQALAKKKSFFLLELHFQFNGALPKTLPDHFHRS
jgi:hypothetical protein